MTITLCFVPALVTGLRHRLYCPLLQVCSVNLFAPSSWRECHPQPNSSLLSTETTAVCSGWLGFICGSLELFSLLTSLVRSHLPTYRWFNVWISQTCLCVEQGVLCGIIAVQLLTNERDKPRGSLMPPFLCCLSKLIFTEAYFPTQYV